MEEASITPGRPEARPTRAARPTVSQWKAAVVGMGVVGRAMADLCGRKAQVLFDLRPDFCQDRQAVNECDIAFVCVPTPSLPDGRCDTSAVEQAVGWIETPYVVVCSTVPPGTTDRLRRSSGKRIVFQPEYVGEGKRHPYQRVGECGFLVLGGPPEDAARVADFHKAHCGASCRFVFCDATTAELAKYMENAFLAAKVTFVNEFYEIARALGVEYNLLREVWLADQRIGSSHTDVYPDARGFSGKCLPKDLSAIIATSREHGWDPAFLEAVRRANRLFLARGEPGEPSGSAASGTS